MNFLQNVVAGMVGNLASVAMTLVISLIPAFISIIIGTLSKPDRDIFIWMGVPISLLLIFILWRVGILQKYPKIRFSKMINIREVKFGERTKKPESKLALSVKVGTKNMVPIHNVTMTLRYLCFESNSKDNVDGALTRHSVEHFHDYADYIEGVHRFSFYCDEMTYKPLSQISIMRGITCSDVVEIVLTGWYGNFPRRFLAKKVYRFKDIKYSDGPAKSMTSTRCKTRFFKKDKIKTKVDWNKFDAFNSELTEEEISTRHENLKRIVERLYIDPNKIDDEDVFDSALTDEDIMDKCKK